MKEKIKEFAKSQIVIHDFNAGSIAYEENYGNPVNIKDLESLITEEKSRKWNGKIGLMSVSDALRASTSNTGNSSFDNWISRSLYLSGTGIAWTINPSNERGGAVWTIDAYYSTSGELMTEQPWSFSRGIFPSIYLSSKIQITGGTGAATNPYTIKL